MKKLIAGVTAIAMLCTLMITSVYASDYYDVSDDAYYADSIKDLTTYGIISGSDGYFDPDANITRAEFSKIAAIVGGYKDEVANNMGDKQFNDVGLYNWATGYINTVAKNKVIVGYPDGAFLPDKPITFAEATTIVLRLLGYTSAELGDNWPYSYMAKASDLGISSGMMLGYDDYITRANLCVIVNRALFTDMYSQASVSGVQTQSSTSSTSGKILLTKMKFTRTDDAIILATKNENKSLAANQIKTDIGTYKIANERLSFTPFTQAKLILNDDGEVVNTVEETVPDTTTLLVDSVVGDNIYFSNGETAKNLGIKDETTVYKNGESFNFSSIKESIEKGSTAYLIYDNDGSVRYLRVQDVNATDAVAVRTDVYTALKSSGVTEEQINSASVYRNNEASSLDEIKQYDVVYYYPETTSIYAYSKKISGVYEEAYPNKTSVTSISLSGTKLDLETQTAAYKLGEKSGSYKINSRFTALLGKDDKIVDIIDLNTSDNGTYGVLLSTAVKNSTDIGESANQIKYINVLTGNGQNMSYKTKSDYSTSVGYAGKISFDEDGFASFLKLGSDSTISGTIDKVNKKIGGHYLTPDAKIIELMYVPDNHTGTATAQVIELDDINLEELSESKVVSAVKSGSFDDISLLFVEDVTKDMYTYGVLLADNVVANSMKVGGTYTVTANGITTTYQSNSKANGLAVGAGVKMTVNGSSLEAISPLIKAGAGICNALDVSRVKIGSNVYSLASNVQIYYYKKGNGTTSASCTSLSINAAQSYFDKTVRIYADKAVGTGGLIRVIVFE